MSAKFPSTPWLTLTATGRRISVAALLLLYALLAREPADAQEEIGPDIQWAYASFLGTGWYKIDNQRSSFIVRASPRWEIGEAGFDDEGNREIGYMIRLPLTLGFSQFDFTDIPGIINPDNYATAGLNLGLDADIPVTRRLSVRPNAEFGYGTVLGESGSAWVYRAEIRSQYRFQPGPVGWTLHGALGYAGQNPNEGPSDDFTYLSATAERGHATRWRSRDGAPVNFHWQLGYTWFMDELDFRRGSDNEHSIGSYWQFAFSLAKEESPFRIWRFKFDRLGLGFNFSPSGEHEAIKLIFRSQYEL